MCLTDTVCMKGELIEYTHYNINAGVDDRIFVI